MAENTEYNVSNLFNKQTSNGKLAFITKGSMNKLLMRPQIINEHTPYDTELQGTITSTNIVGQIFKASKDNINGLTVSLGGANGETTIDNFESYISSINLRTTWQTTGGSDGAILNTSIYSPNESSTQSMELEMDESYNEWTKTITSTDFTGVTISLDYYQNVSFSYGKISLFVGDGTNTKSIQLAVTSSYAWEFFELMTSAMTEDGGGTTDLTAITKIGFRVDNESEYDEGFVDNLCYCSESGKIKIKLFDMGSEQPVSGTTKLNDGTQYTDIGDLGVNGALVSDVDVSVKGSKRFYQINEFICGTAKERDDNDLLTIGNYYALTFNYIDSNINIYGTDTSLSKNFYTDGYAFSTPDESSVITTLGEYNDIKFNIFSTQDIYVLGSQIKMFTEDGSGALPGANATYLQGVIDVDNIIDTYIVTTIQAYNNGDRDLQNRPIFIKDGGKIGTYYQDDEDDDVYKLIFNIIYLYEK